MEVRQLEQGFFRGLGGEDEEAEANPLAAMAKAAQQAASAMQQPATATGASALRRPNLGALGERGPSSRSLFSMVTSEEREKLDRLAKESSPASESAPSETTEDDDKPKFQKRVLRSKVSKHMRDCVVVVCLCVC